MSVKKHLSFANIVALTTPFVALGRGAYALGSNSVGTKQLKNNAVVTKSSSQPGTCCFSEVGDGTVQVTAGANPNPSGGATLGPQALDAGSLTSAGLTAASAGCAASTNWVVITNFANTGGAVDGSFQIAFFDCAERGRIPSRGDSA